MDDREYVEKIERLNAEINRVENSFGRGPFYDGILRERLVTLWQQRADLGEARNQLAATQ